MQLYKKDGITLIGNIEKILSCEAEEERNGLFEAVLDCPLNNPLFNDFVEENIIVCKPNDIQDNQAFRIYNTTKFMNNVKTVYARHISFDLAYDFLDTLILTNSSCENALNEIFRQSQFSKHYRGYSDIIQAQNYSMELSNCLEAIAGKEGSIIDTFGNGAEILRDNTNFHVLNKRGHDNGVTIEYSKNLTGFELNTDFEGLITKIKPYAKYKNDDNEEVVIKGDFVNSPNHDSFSHSYIRAIDYSDKFSNDEVPTVAKLHYLAEQEYLVNKVHIPKANYKIEFIPLSRCVGYSDIEDRISICDTVTVIDSRYGIDTKAKVIKYKYDVINQMYLSMELGEPRTTLGDIITSNDGKDGENGKDGQDGAQGPPGEDGKVEDMPDTLPAVPVLTPKVYGMGSVELSWTFENKLYYTYELYASRTKDFTPNSFDLMHAGQSSSFLFKANPDETWYFKVCAMNSHNKRTGFSNQVEVALPKIEDMNNYFSEIAIGHAVAQSITADYMEAGIVKGHWIDAKNLSVTDGNGVRTLDIDSSGNVALNVAKLQISSKNVATSDTVNGKISKGEAITDINITPGSTKIKSNKLDIQGATTIGDGQGNYVGVDGYNYSAYTNYIRTMYFGGYQENGIFIPSMYMGASGFNSNSSSYDGSYFAMKNYGSYHHLAFRSRLSGQWSIINFNEAGDISFTPHVKCVFHRPAVFRQGFEIRDEYGIDLYDWNGNLKGRISRGIFECTQIKSIDNTVIQVKNSVRNMTWENGMGTPDGRWYTIYLSSAPDISSDITLKENIVYTDEKSIIPRMANIIEDDSLTYQDMYEFYRDIYRSAEYNYLKDDKRVLGIIAQDIVNTKVGDKIIRHNKDGKLSYSQETRVTVLEGALKEAISEIEHWKGKYIDLESKVDFIMEKLK